MTLQTATQINQDAAQRRDHYIPIGKRDLVELMVSEAELSGEQARAFRRFAGLLESRFHLEFYETLRDLGECYSAFDPDCIVVDLEHDGEATPAEKRQAFFRHLEWLLDRANYTQLSRDDIDSALTAAKMFGIRLSVNFDAFQHLAVYVRGETLDDWELRKWYHLFRPTIVSVPIYRRLVLVFQFTPESQTSEEPSHEIVLKIFKNIPKSDIDILLPSSQVKLSMLDRGKIILPTISGVGLTFYKVIKAGMIFTFFSGFYGMLAFLTFVGGTIGYGIKSFFGYLHTKDKYQLSLTRHLYYQNLGNNKGVLFRILHDAEEQEFREAIIAYYLLWQRGAESVITKEQLDRRAESWIESHTGVAVDFEDDDALGKLERLGLATCQEGNWQALPLAQALERLEYERLKPMKID